MTLDMAAVARDRITFKPETQYNLQPIPWAEGMRPEPQDSVLAYDGSVPQADVLVITWTEAEGMALADVLSPGVRSADWVDYARDFPKYAKQLTGRSPARESKRLGSFYMVTIGSIKVCLFKSELHPATDGPSLPTAQLVAQLIGETGCRCVITTGTAGGAGDGTQLGDVNVATAIHADFTTRLKGKPWSTEEWSCPAPAAEQNEYLSITGGLFGANSGHLPPLYVKRQPKVWNGHVVSTDFFAFDAEDDHYGLRAYDPAIRAVEMDDAAVAAGADGKVPVYSVRNASDPVMPDGSEQSAREAEKIYEKYGYFTTINSAICTWALIAGMNAQ